MLNAIDIVKRMEALRNEAQRVAMMRFFKTREGEYGYGDEFLGIKVPQTRLVVKEARTLPLSEVQALLNSRWHEVRLCGLLIMVAQFEAQSKKRLIEQSEAVGARDTIVEMYINNVEKANNWDLVDLSAPRIIGHWLLLPTFLGLKDSGVPHIGESCKLSILDRLASSENLWAQRVSMVCTLMPTRMGEPSYALRFAEYHLGHSHDLMHKAVGWMLREVGKHCGLDLLRDFLEKHHAGMARTTLRYAIELMDADERQAWLRR